MLGLRVKGVRFQRRFSMDSRVCIKLDRLSLDGFRNCSPGRANSGSGHLVGGYSWMCFGIGPMLFPFLSANGQSSLSKGPRITSEGLRTNCLELAPRTLVGLA